MTQYYFVDELRPSVWFGSLWPRLLKDAAGQSRTNFKIHYVEGAPRMTAVARRMARRIGASVEPFSFRMLDVRDDAGCLIRLRIAYSDLAEIRNNILSDPAFQAFLSETGARAELETFLAKNSVLGITFFGQDSLWRAAYFVHVCLWRMRRDAALTASGSVQPKAALFLSGRPWLSGLAQYAAQYGIEIVGTTAKFHAKALLLELGGRDARLLVEAAGRLLHRDFPRWSAAGLDRRASKTPRVALQYYGHFNLDRPDLHSDFFFWQQSELTGNRLLALFDLASDPLDRSRREALDREGIASAPLGYSATTLPAGEVFPWFGAGRRIRVLGQWLADFGESAEVRWLRSQAREFQLQRDYWARVFEVYNVKAYTAWFKYDGAHCAIAAAVRDAGGVMTLYQRASEELPTAETAVCADVYFGFAPDGARVEALSGSSIRYHVATGYLGDHRFPLARQRAHTVRAHLQSNGARRILAYFDENSHPDARWSLGHDLTREAYSFLLEKTLSQSEIGLLLKPKTPRTLRQRLGPVADLLERALATGRCHLYETGLLQSAMPPVEAAMAADIVIHGHLFSATAGVEAALAGAPTLLMDREGWPMSPLWRLGRNRVVFTSWPDVWQACEDYWSSPGGVPGFGDWSSMLPELDPFRDGRAAERMGQYLNWLMEGFEAGLARDLVLADAAERYGKMWGRDKVSEVQPVHSQGQTVA